MSKAIMISIKPKWVAKILNGEKTIEIRKTMPKCDLPIDVYIYCTKEKLYGDEYLCKESRLKGQISWCEFMRFDGKDMFEENEQHKILNGKVVAKFTLRKVDEHHVLPTENILPFNWNVEKKLSELCLTKEEVMAYGHGEDYQAFLWHIEDLVIFDEPKELNEFWTISHKVKGKKGQYTAHKLSKAPQKFQYIMGSEE